MNIEPMPRCFVLMPVKREFVNLWDAVIRPAIENAGMQPRRGEDVAQNHHQLMDGIRREIMDAQVVVAVLSGADPNVLYETGLAHAAKKRVVLVLERGEVPPSNLAHLLFVEYDPSDYPSSRTKLQQALQDSLHSKAQGDPFPELKLLDPTLVEEYRYLRESRKTFTIKVRPRNCSIFFNNRYLGQSPQTLRVNPDAQRNVVSVSASDHFEYYKVLTPEDLAKGEIRVELNLRDKAQYPERVNTWLRQRREDPDNPVLSRAISNYLIDQKDLAAAREEALFCISKAPDWFGGYNVLGFSELFSGFHDKALAHFRTVVNLNPDDYLGYYNLACAVALAGNAEQAFEFLETILTNPGLSDSYRNSISGTEDITFEQDRNLHSLRSNPAYAPRFTDIARRFNELAASPEPPLIAKPSPDMRATEKRPPYPYALKQFQIEEFQCIRATGAVDLPIDAPWIFMTGENGDGKTSLLQALAVGFYGPQDADHLIERNQDCRIGIQVREDGTDRMRQVQWFGDHWKTVDPGTGEALGPLTRLVAYGPARLSLHGSSLEVEDQLEQSNPVASLFHGGMLINIESWIKDQLLEEAAGRAKETRRRKVQLLLARIMPNVSEMVVDGKNIEYVEKGHRVPLHHLSSGHRNLLALVGDLLVRLFQAQPEVDEPKELSGIVLIDELEAHIHPKWQLELPILLSETFPRVQFIATTHSALPMQGAPEGSVFLRVRRDELKGTSVERLTLDPRRLLPNALYTSPAFDLESIINPETTDLASVRTEDDYREMEENVAREERLSGDKQVFGAALDELEASLGHDQGA